MFGKLFDKIIREIEIQNGGKPSGESGGGTGAPGLSNIEEFLPNGGGPLALPIGRHIARGQLFYNKYAGSPPFSRFITGMGEGLGLGWNGILRSTWGGQPLAQVALDSTADGVHFHPGYYSSGPGDPKQGVDTYFPGHPLTYSGTAHVCVKLPELMSSEQAPQKFVSIIEGLKLPRFDHTGQRLGIGTETEFVYSTNPADVIAFAAWRTGLLHRINWPSWSKYRAYCDALIDWNDGTGVRQIKRFEAHPVWSEQISLVMVLDTMSLITGMVWQDDHETIRFILPDDQTPIHHFTKANTVTGSVKTDPIPFRSRCNHLTIKSRDIETDWIEEFSAPIEDLERIIKYGRNPKVLNLPNMTQSHAQRIGQMIINIISKNPVRGSVEGYSDSLHVLEGDWVLVDDDNLNWKSELCRVTEITEYSIFKRPDVRRFGFQKIKGKLYSDTDHGPKEVASDPDDE